MLDLNHPQTEHIFQASRLLGDLGECVNRMSVGSSEIRSGLLPDARTRIDELRTLAAEHFARSQAIPPALDELEKLCVNLAGLGDGKLTVDTSDGDGACPACAGEIMKFDAMAGLKRHPPHWIIVCQNCTSGFSKPLRKLESGDCFSTTFI